MKDHKPYKMALTNEETFLLFSLLFSFVAILFSLLSLIRSLFSGRRGRKGPPGVPGENGVRGEKGDTGEKGPNSAALGETVGRIFYSNGFEPIANVLRAENYIPLFQGGRVEFFTGSIEQISRIFISTAYNTGDPNNYGDTRPSFVGLLTANDSPQRMRAAFGNNSWTSFSNVS